MIRDTSAWRRQLEELTDEDLAEGLRHAREQAAENPGAAYYWNSRAEDFAQILNERLRNV